MTQLKFLLFTDFPGGRADKTLPANAGDTGSIPDPRRFHVPRSSEAPEPQLLSLHSIPHEPPLLKAEPASNPLSATRGSRNEKPEHYS